MAQIITKDEIISIVQSLDVVSAMEEGFIQYSNGLVVVPPVGELLFDDPPGDVHLKYGYIKKDKYYVIKIASGFYKNSLLGLPSGNGLMLVFSQQTGAVEAVLLDEGYLTDIRTAAAGALAAKYFAPKKISGIGIIGTGTQARMQLAFLLKQQDCEEIWLWGRNVRNANGFKKSLDTDVKVRLAESVTQLAAHCNLIVTTTPSELALLHASDLQKGTHITAVGSDTSDKQELESEILEIADIVVADSIPQSKSRGEIYQAIKSGIIKSDKVWELGTAIQNTDLQRKNDDQISVVDLTGVAVQDIMISKAVYLAHLKKDTNG